MNPYDFLLRHGHWLEHCVEASIMLLLTVAIIVGISRTVGSRMETEIDYMIKNPCRTFIVNTVIFLIYVIASYYIVQTTHVHLWNHDSVVELRDQWNREHFVEHDK